MNIRIWSARLLIVPVLFFNLQCSLAFLFSPALYAPSFDLYEIPGIYMIQGLGLLFLMWNIPYVVAVINPQKYVVSLIEAVIMQAIGVIAESILLMTIPLKYALLHTSVTRFIVFDGSGLILLIIALLLCLTKPLSLRKHSPSI